MRQKKGKGFQKPKRTIRKPTTNYEKGVMVLFSTLEPLGYKEVSSITRVISTILGNKFPSVVISFSPELAPETSMETVLLIRSTLLPFTPWLAHYSDQGKTVVLIEFTGYALQEPGSVLAHAVGFNKDSDPRILNRDILMGLASLNGQYALPSS
jgi:hypothetical protein